jgi:hypothetical protein
MAIEYHVYANDGAGGAVNYASPVAVVSSPSYVTTALATPSDNTFAIRAFDDVTGLEEGNTDATVRIVVGPTGIDQTAVPNSPLQLSARATSGGGCRVEFVYVATGQLGAPSEWRVWLFSGLPNFTLAPAVVFPVSWPTLGGIYRHIMLDLTGLADGVDYLIGARAANSSGDDGNVATVAVTGRNAGPMPVSGLSGLAGYGSIG